MRCINIETGPEKLNSSKRIDAISRSTRTQEILDME